MRPDPSRRPAPPESPGAREAARLIGVAGDALGRLGRFEEANSRLREALAGLDTGVPDPDAADLAARLAGALVFSGHADQAVPHLETALAYAQALELPDVVSSALIAKAFTLEIAGRYSEALLGHDGPSPMRATSAWKRRVLTATPETCG